MGSTSTFVFLTQGSGEDARIDLQVFNSLLVGRALSAEDQAIANTLALSVATTGGFPFRWTPQEDAYIRSSDPSRWLDYLIYRFKFKVYPVIKRVAEFPIYLLVEPVSACNLRCPMCFQVDKGFTKKPFMGKMDMDLYRRIIAEAVAGGTRAITLASRGEPTLHPQLREMLAEASGGKFIDLKLNTNATMLTDDLARDILRSDVNELVFSIDSHEREAYERIRVGASFDVTLHNVRRFHEIRATEFPGSRLQTRVSGVRLDPQQDVEGFIAFWSKIVDHVGYVDAESRWDTYNNEPHPDLAHACNYLFERMYIWWDGVCNPCDVDYMSHLSPGRFPEQSIRDIWHGDAYTQMRKEHLAGRRNMFDPCDRCGV